MRPIRELSWDDHAIEHLWKRGVTPDEVEEVIFGVDGEPATYRIERDADAYLIFGETGAGRLLLIIAEDVGDAVFRPYGAREMNDNEKRRYRKG